MTLVHITIIFLLSTIARSILYRWTGKPRVILSWTDYIYRAAPTGETVVQNKYCKPQKFLELLLDQWAVHVKQRCKGLRVKRRVTLNGTHFTEGLAQKTVCFI